MISYYNNNDFSMYTYDPNGKYDNNYKNMNHGMNNGYNYNPSMYNTMNSNNMYNGPLNNINSGVPNCYNIANTYGYCPYMQNNMANQSNLITPNNVVDNQFRGNCPYDSENYQYSPTVNCINPYYPQENHNRSFENNFYNGDIKIRTVSIEDIRD